MFKKKQKVYLKYIGILLALILLSFVFYIITTNYNSKKIEDSQIISGQEDISGDNFSKEDNLSMKIEQSQGILGENFSDIIEDLYQKYNPPQEEEIQDYSSSNQNSDNTQAETQEESEPLPPVEPTSCPISTLGCVKCEIGEQYCRYEEGEESGYLGWACQNNNPSNIRYSQYRADYITQMGGIAPCGEKGGFMVFATYEIGYNSVKAYIRAINVGIHPAYRIYNCGDCTLLQFFSKYAPNNPEGYAGRVAEIMGNGVNMNETKLNWVVENRLDDFVKAIQHIEGYWTQDGRL